MHVMEKIEMKFAYTVRMLGEIYPDFQARMKTIVYSFNRFGGMTIGEQV
jgi:hypothetical protein